VPPKQADLPDWLPECARGFERRFPECAGCDNSFLADPQVMSLWNVGACHC
jgi:hypothetical protein